MSLSKCSRALALLWKPGLVRKRRQLLKRTDLHNPRECTEGAGQRGRPFPLSSQRYQGLCPNCPYTSPASVGKVLIRANTDWPAPFSVVLATPENKNSSVRGVNG